ncbi:MAG TPA: hypothetical protein DHW71_14525 [Gammaproteobacteria bacterium]|nr:hypothetical protein [Gammaproteobacteria bacterium]MEC8009247.1 ATP-dependent zinc metalloprotease FtsH [Pseudomonadota bacterium]HBF06751.1 hypothetical protein [Gammaproteobacteria bacterium]HCK94209.1 hypothetical protein [Gammaproteobacteria bacterium]|tara:strand:- start:2178 stop:4538 length:2361 start_codon:yes stop_codon:yes gene_type:complete
MTRITKQSQAALQTLAPQNKSDKLDQIASPYNTRLQSRLNQTSGAAMNDPEAGKSLDKIAGQKKVSSRFVDKMDIDSKNADGLSDTESDSDYVDNGSGVESDDEMTEAPEGSGGSQSSGSTSDAEEVESDDEVDMAADEGQVIDLEQMIQQIVATAAAADNYLNLIDDKNTFLSSVGVELNDDGSLEHMKNQERADKMWDDFKTFNSTQCDVILSVDRMDLSELMSKIHVDPKLESKQKRQLLNFCTNLGEAIQDIKNKDLEFKQKVADLNAKGLPSDDLLRINTGDLTKAMNILKDTQSALQSVGHSLKLDNLQVALKSGLKVEQAQKNFPITFKDVMGIDEVKVELQEIVNFLKDPKSFSALGARIPKGVLLSGPPGTGKTLLAKAVAGEAGVPFMSVSGSNFVEEYVGVGAKRVRDLFQQAASHDKCILFIDEIDAVGGKRSSGSNSNAEREQTLNQLLTELDGFTGRSGTIVMAATNRPDMLDGALMRPGRFDRDIAVPLPTVNGREAILKLHAAKRKVDDKVDFNATARRTSGFSGAELENLLNEAALIAGRAGKKAIEQSDIELAFDKMIMGMEMPSFHMSEKNKLNTAYHEAGHAIASYMSKETNEVYKITIIPHGRSLGATHYLTPEDDTSVSYAGLKSKLCSLLGGRIAEEILCGHEGVTTGASNDLERASAIARQMVTEWGFAKSLGPVTFKDSHGNQAPVSAQTAQLIDDEVKNLVVEAETNARKILTTHKDKLDAVAAVLMDKETIDQSEFFGIMQAPAKGTPVAQGAMKDLMA